MNKLTLIKACSYTSLYYIQSRDYHRAIDHSHSKHSARTTLFYFTYSTCSSLKSCFRILKPQQPITKSIIVVSMHRWWWYSHKTVSAWKKEINLEIVKLYPFWLTWRAFIIPLGIFSRTLSVSHPSFLILLPSKSFFLLFTTMYTTYNLFVDISLPRPLQIWTPALILVETAMNVL